MRYVNDFDWFLTALAPVLVASSEARGLPALTRLTLAA
jgi:hypothetical protein